MLAHNGQPEDGILVYRHQWIKRGAGVNTVPSLKLKFSWICYNYNILIHTKQPYLELHGYFANKPTRRQSTR